MRLAGENNQLGKMISCYTFVETDGNTWTLQHWHNIFSFPQNSSDMANLKALFSSFGAIRMEGDSHSHIKL